MEFFFKTTIPIAAHGLTKDHRKEEPKVIFLSTWVDRKGLLTTLDHRNREEIFNSIVIYADLLAAPKTEDS